MKRVALYLLAAAVLFAGCSEKSAGPVAGALRPEHHFTLKTVDGGTVKLEEVLKTHKAVLINFFATWCPPCQEEMPDLVKLHAENKDRGFTVLGVEVGEPAKEVAKFIQDYKINFPVGMDSDQSVAQIYGVPGVPTTLLVLADGTVVGTYHAFTPELKADVEKALNG